MGREFTGEIQNIHAITDLVASTAMHVGLKMTTLGKEAYLALNFRRITDTKYFVVPRISTVSSCGPRETNKCVGEMRGGLGPSAKVWLRQPCAIDRPICRNTTDNQGRRGLSNYACREPSCWTPIKTNLRSSIVSFRLYFPAI